MGDAGSCAELCDGQPSLLGQALNVIGSEEIVHSDDPMCNNAITSSAFMQTDASRSPCKFARMDEQQAFAKAMLERIMALSGLDATNLARKAGLSPSTLTRFLNAPVKHSLSHRTLMKISRASGVALDDTLDEQGPPEMRPRALPADISMVPSFEGIAEMNVIGGLGTGGSAAVEQYTADGNSVSADEVRDIWNLPPSYISGELRLTSKRARIIEVRGDSMEPTLYSGDRVMIDVADRALAQEGIFALWDGDGVSVKRVERVRPSEPPMLRLISDNARHREVELLAEEVQIIGRVVWVARKM